MHSTCVKQFIANQLQYILLNTMRASTQQKKMTLHYNIIYKHRQTKPHLSFVFTLYKSTSALINTLLVLQMSENESTTTKNIHPTFLQQFFKEIVPIKLLTRV